MDSELREVCERLDDTLLGLMQSLKELSSLRNRYRDAVREGYFTMSQARHAMGGPSHVSPLQYDSTMKALVRIQVDDSTGSHDDQASSSECRHAEFKVHRVKPGVPKAASSRLVEQEEGVARRRKGEEPGGVVEELGQMGVEEGEELKDPLKWFGILVPQNLRRSQQCFVEAVSICAEMAAAQVRVQLAQRQYEELLAKKKELMPSK